MSVDMVFSFYLHVDTSSLQAHALDVLYTYSIHLYILYLSVYIYIHIHIHHCQCQQKGNINTHARTISSVQCCVYNLVSFWCTGCPFADMCGASSTTGWSWRSPWNPLLPKLCSSDTEHLLQWPFWIPIPFWTHDNLSRTWKFSHYIP